MGHFFGAPCIFLKDKDLARGSDSLMELLHTALEITSELKRCFIILHFITFFLFIPTLEVLNGKSLMDIECANEMAVTQDVHLRVVTI